MSVVWPVLPQGFLALGWCPVTGSGAGWAVPSSGSPGAVESTELTPAASAYGPSAAQGFSAPALSSFGPHKSLLGGYPGHCDA